MDSITKDAYSNLELEYKTFSGLIPASGCPYQYNYSDSVASFVKPLAGRAQCVGHYSNELGIVNAGQELHVWITGMSDNEYHYCLSPSNDFVHVTLHNRRWQDEATSKHQPQEFQAEIVEKSQVWCELISRQIRKAYDHLEPMNALHTISQVWESLDRASQLAEARSRLTIGRLDRPPMADVPTWLAEQIKTLSSPEAGVQSADAFALETASKLIRSCLHDSTSSQTAELQSAPMGHILVDWDIGPNMLQWEISPATLSWPGVKLNSVFMDNSKQTPELQVRIFHNAFDVIRYFRELTAGNSIKGRLSFTPESAET